MSQRKHEVCNISHLTSNQIPRLQLQIFIDGIDRQFFGSGKYGLDAMLLKFFGDQFFL
jgi:hypothetical protein